MNAAASMLGRAAWGLRLKRAFPAIAFFGGFLWDAATLGRSIKSLDLFILFAYLACAGGILVWMARTPPKPPRSGEELDSVTWRTTLREEGPDLALQFLFGGLFSALVIFYFLSSSYLPGFIVVIALAALLTLNEFLGGHFRRFTLSWTLFATCAILFLNFALPHLFRSVSSFWFYASTALGFGLVVALKRLSPPARGDLRPAAAVAAALVGLYIVGGIPPVPLVKKHLVICRDLEKRDGRYFARIESPPIWAPWRNTDRLVHQKGGEKVFCYTSVFLPPGIATTLYHVWQHHDPRSDKWVTLSRIGFPVRGGRAEGYRGFTFKRNLPPGRWQVRVETEGGRVIGLNRFRVEAVPPDQAIGFRDLTLP